MKTNLNELLNDKVDKAVSVLKPLVKPRILKDVMDETYVQVNQISFQQNFKALIGHYKKTGSYNTVLNT